MSSRDHGIGRASDLVDATNRSMLDDLVASLSSRQRDHLVNEDARKMDLFRWNRPGRNHVFGFDDRYRAGHRADGVEVVRGHPENGVAVSVGLPRSHQAEVR